MDVIVAPITSVPMPVARARTLNTSALVLTTLAGSFVANVGAQFVGTHVADVQGSFGASADEASWITTVYTAANFFGFVLSPVLARSIGLRRFFVASALIFAATAWFSAMTTSFPTLLVLRALQGLVGGAFGPIAFMAIFRAWAGSPRLVFGLALLAGVLLVSTNAGPALSGPLENAFGWRALFLVQAAAAVLLVLAGLRWVPAAPLDRAALQTDWVAIFLLALATSSLMVVMSQGTRRFWFDNSLIAWAASVSVGAWIGFAIQHCVSPVRILNARLLLNRRLGVPIALNLVFRTTFSVTVYLIPLLLLQAQAYRPLQAAQAWWWLLLPQLAMFPIAWRLLHRVDARTLMLPGLLIAGLGIGLAAVATNQTGSDQLRLSLVLLGAGQMLFFVPILVIGAGSLKAEEGPTATIAFNMTTVGGTTIGVGLLSHFVNEREKFHSNVLVDHLSWLNPLQGDRLSALAGQWANRSGDDALANARALAQMGSAVRREAWLLSINDGFGLAAVCLLAMVIGIALLSPSPPLARHR